MREFRTAICISQSPDITAIRVDLIKSKMMPHLVVRYALRFTQSLSLKLTAPKLSMEGSYYGVCLHRDIETITAHVPRIKGFLNSNVFFLFLIATKWRFVLTSAKFNCKKQGTGCAAHTLLRNHVAFANAVCKTRKKKEIDEESRGIAKLRCEWADDNSCRNF